MHNFVPNNFKECDLRKEFDYEHIKKYNGRLQAILACTLV
jgi:hypothetical protein